MAWNYSEKTQQLFMDAVKGKPGTHLGEIENPDGLGEHGSIACGDALRFTFRVEPHATDPTQDIIVEARYLTFGCTSAIASSEALCDLIEAGRYTPIQALKIQNKDIVEYLEGLPQQKIHCSVMGAEALEAAVFDWAKRRGVDLSLLGVDLRPEEREAGRIVCDCFDLSDFIGQDVWFGFFFGSDGSITYPGWYIKWIKTGGGQVSPVEDTSWGAIKAMYR